MASRQHPEKEGHDSTKTIVPAKTTHMATLYTTLAEFNTYTHFIANCGHREEVDGFIPTFELFI
jgi:hypothetical protein